MKIIFAGSENRQGFTEVLVPVKAKHLLVSYFYMRKENRAKLHTQLTELRKQANYLFLDSGAHSFLTASWERAWGGGSWKKKKTLDPFTYVKDYVDWLKEFEGYFDAIAELDVAWVYWVTYDDVEDWRKQFCSIGIKNKLVVVSHYRMFTKLFWGWTKEWERLCTEYPLLAIGDQPPENVLDMHFAIWKKVGNLNRVHGFAETKIGKVLKYPYYSVDSTSWSIGSRFWIMQALDEENMAFKVLWSLDRTKTDTIEAAKEKFSKHMYPIIDKNMKWHPIDDFFDWSWWKYRDMQNCYSYMRLEEIVTQAWAKRGIDLETNLPKNYAR